MSRHHRQSNEEDEALARELQQRFAAEFRQSQQEQQRRRSAGDNNRRGGEVEAVGRGSAAPGTSSWTARRSGSTGTSQQQPVRASNPTIVALPVERASRRSYPIEGSSASSSRPPPAAKPTASKPSSGMSDEEYALRLERAFQDEERAAASLNGSSHHRRSDVRGGGTAPGRGAFSGPDGSAFSSNYGLNPPPPSKNPEYLSPYDDGRRREAGRKVDPHSLSGLSSFSSHSRGAPAADADEEFARRLQEELRREEAARRQEERQGRTLATGLPKPAASARMDTPQTLSDDVSDMTSDEELARRVEQELRDEELARRLSAQEQARASESRARQIQAAASATSVPSTPRRCSVRRSLSYVVPSFVLAAVVVGVVLYFTQFNQQIPFIPSPQDFQSEDPFNAKNASDVDRWRTQGLVGLNLEVVAALESSWLPYFETAVFQWDNGSPDSLTLSKSYEEHQTACDPINYKLIVCNGDYGDTRWRGINKILLADGFIFASAAKMNEYYFTGSSDTDDQRQYTMCHEMGHGFGLPHSDESFTNADLGNCMDYTNNPGVNKQPDVTNYRFLEELYGDVPGSGNGTTAQSEDVHSDSSGGRRLIRERKDRHDDPIPDWVLKRWRSMDRELGNHARGAEQRSSGWRVLHQSDYGEAHEMDIGSGYTIQVHKLFH